MSVETSTSLRPDEQIIFKTEGAMQYGDDLYTSYPGFITLTNQRIFWSAVGLLKGKEVENSFELNDIKTVKFGSMIINHRLVIYLKNGDSHLINQIDKKAGREFVNKVNQLLL
ncbi:PH domain-containing protein [Macrococcus lamae]|uniref:YokE-like PH domain-containing protein n=1 Tax=Macrococcus lamae TaxID=198484 RepID=A0A4R6BXI8_9STAP|nr:PH domain-containing protein [Macrococcus lamae]TDM12728.1 hypothetical protein ERX29_01615 [Macrococcus lamae]